MVFESNSEKDTFDLGRQIGEKAVPGDVYTLVGDLGVGKTVFTKGLAKGLGIEEPVSSPTFTIVQIYEEGRMPLYHFDVYRIGDVEEMEEIGYEDCIYGEGVSLIEWADLIEEILPEHYVHWTAPGWWLRRPSWRKSRQSRHTQSITKRPTLRHSFPWWMR